MAVVGEAKIVVRAITTQVKPDIERGLRGLSGSVEKAGKDMGRSLDKGFSQEAAAARLKLQALSRAGFVFQGVIGSLGGAISSVVVSLGSLVGAAGGAAASLGALSGVVAAFPAGLAAARLGLGGIGAALQEAEQGGSSFGGTLVDVREELQQLRFEAEQASLSEDQAALNLENARNNLLRVQDLAPNSMIRRQAELDLREADLAFRRAKDRAGDLQDELANPDFSGGGGGGAAAQSAYDDLLPSQQRFVDFLRTLQPVLDDLKAASANSFLPILQTQIERLIAVEPDVGSFFGVLREGIQQSAIGLGLLVTNFTDFLVERENLQELDTIFVNIKDTLASFGTIVGNVFDSFLSITEASDSTTRRFLNFLESKTGTFAEFLDTRQASGDLESFFKRAGDLAADFGEILGNIGGFFNDLIRDSFSEESGGQILLDWLKDATQGWQDLRETVGESGFREYMAETALNSVAVLQSIGAFISEFGKLSDMPEIREAARNFMGAADSFGTIVEEAIKVSPIFADLVSNLLEIIAVFADSSAAVMFFEILETGTRAVADLLENELIADFVNFAGVLFAIGLAAGTVFKTINFFTLALVGFGQSITAGLAGIQAGLASTTVAARVASVAIRSIPFVGLAAAAVTGITILMDKINNDVISKAPVASDELTGMFNAGKTGAEVLKTALSGISGELAIADQSGLFVRPLGIAFDGAALSAGTFKEALQAVSDRFEDVRTFEDLAPIISSLPWNPVARDMREFENQLEEVGVALAGQAERDLPAATEAFKSMANELNLSDKEALALLDTMPDFRDELERQANAAGLAGTDQELLNIALQDGGDYFVTAGDAANPYIEALEGVKEAARESEERVRDLEDALFNFGSETLDARAAARQLEAQKDRLKDAVTELVEEEGSLDGALNDTRTGFDRTTDSGRNLEKEFDNLVQTLVDKAESNYELSGSEDQLREDFKAAREELERQAEELGLTEEAADNLADALLGNDYEVETTIKKITDEEVEQAFLSVEEALKRSRAMYIEVLPYSRFTDPEVANRRYGPASENPIANKDGGFISGPGTGRSDSIPALLSNGEFVVNSRATRENRQLLEMINDNRNVSMKPNVSVTVNASRGMDERELAELVSRKIAFDIRRGSI